MVKEQVTPIFLGVAVGTVLTALAAMYIVVKMTSDTRRHRLTVWVIGFMTVGAGNAYVTAAQNEIG